ncbi:hypothetical protein K1719_021201 [Acacia pycnantha]|nr:hypothetical protein K1719_021201 [Acacia pycnantha]
MSQARHLFSDALDRRHFEGIVDERLENDYDVEEMFRMISCAANCVRHSAINRPPMTQWGACAEFRFISRSSLSNPVVLLRPSSVRRRCVLASSSVRDVAVVKWGEQFASYFFFRLPRLVVQLKLAFLCACSILVSSALDPSLSLCYVAGV